MLEGGNAAAGGEPEPQARPKNTIRPFQNRIDELTKARREEERQRIAAEARCAFNQAFRLGGGTCPDIAADDPGRRFIRPLLEMQAAFQNQPPGVSPYAYAAVDGFPVPLELVNVYPVHPGDEVVLASDGYPLVLPTLSESERYLRRVLEEDPCCLSLFKSTKGKQAGNRSFDDRAYVRFTLE